MVMEKETFLVESVSGKWVRLPSNFRKASYVLELPNGILLNVHASNGCIELYTKAEDQVYRYSGELFLEADPKQPHQTTKIIYDSNELKRLSGAV